MITKTESIVKAVRKYDLVVTCRWKDDAGFRQYTLARRNSGSRGGHKRNERWITITASQDIELRRLGVLRHSPDYHDYADGSASIGVALRAEAA
jgi:hypothetical protein